MKKHKTTIIFIIGGILNLAIGLFVNGQNKYVTYCNFLIAGLCISSIFYNLLLESQKNIIIRYANLTDKLQEQINILLTKIN